MSVGKEKSKLVQRIYDESTTTTLDVGLYGILETFANHVLPELTQTNQLFDEYTPHDQTHMESLFRITDELLGDEQINQLNGCEALILACSIYGHDWGMAVSSDEKELIVTGTIPSGRNRSEFALLDHENERWVQFSKSICLNINDSGHVENESDVPKELWREYVRKTHSERCHARVIHYFSGRDLEPLGYVVGETCAGHWYDISQIRQLPSTYSCLGSIINLQAVTVYMRFIDLLDLSANRTPYSLWKYVNPRNAVSALEWKKHRALSPVSFIEPSDNNQYRQILLHGRTEDYRVYAALQDLKRYCESQINENEAVLFENREYSLGPLKLDWKVEAVGFDPIDIRFEFDRTRMFELVSGEIYDGDPYVFLRELIQNSIDATKVRQLRLRKDADLEMRTPHIRVNVNHAANGDATISVTDQGSGMDIHTIRDYLAVIGKSYYRSSEFSDLGLDMTPISRFGVGLLSCFEVADSILIQTRIDPNIEESDALEIEILEFTQQFRVTRISTNQCQVGTTVTVNVRGSKWQKDESSEFQKLRVADYLKVVAAFSPVPIHICEDQIETIIVSPMTSETEVEQLCTKFPNSEVSQEQLDFKLSEVVLVQDKDKALHFYQEHTLNLDKVVNGSRLKGAIAYFMPHDRVLYSQRLIGNSQTGVNILFNQDNNLFSSQIRWKPNDSKNKATGIAQSAKRTLFNRVYLRGILLPDIDDISPKTSGWSPSPRVTVNIESDTNSMVPFLSRRGVRDSFEMIHEAISAEFHDEIRLQYENQFEQANPLRRLMLLSRLACYVVPPDSLDKIFSTDQWPIPFFDQTGQQSLHALQDLPSTIEIVPSYFMQEHRQLRQIFSPIDWFENRLPNVNELISSSLQKLYIANFGISYDDGSPIEWDAIRSCIFHALSKQFRTSRIRVGHIKQSNTFYVIEQQNRIGTQSCTHKTDTSKDFRFYPFDVQSPPIFCIVSIMKHPKINNLVQHIIVNIEHEAGRILQQAFIAFKKRHETLSEYDAGRLHDVRTSIGNIHFTRYTPGSLNSNIEQWVPKFCRTVAQYGLLELSDSDNNFLNLPLTILTCYE